MGMDGRSTFFLGQKLEKYLIFFQTLSYTFRTCFKIFFPRNSKKFKKKTFFKNCRQNRGLVFFPLFQTLIYKFLENNLIFFLTAFGPHRRLFKTSSAKKSKNFKYVKNRLKSQFWAIF